MMNLVTSLFHHYPSDAQEYSIALKFLKIPLLLMHLSRIGFDLLARMSGHTHRIKSLGLRFLDETNITVSVLCACFSLYTKSAAVAYFIAGAVVCSLTVKVIKKFIRQPRPPHVAGRKKKVSYGMPSTHSASIACMAASVILACIHLPIHESLKPESFWRAAPLLLVPPWALTIMMSRVWLGHHTWAQVFAGAGYGICVAWVWYMMWTNGLSDIGEVIESMVMKWLNLR